MASPAPDATDDDPQKRKAHQQSPPELTPTTSTKRIKQNLELETWETRVQDDESLIAALRRSLATANEETAILRAQISQLEREIFEIREERETCRAEARNAALVMRDLERQVKELKDEVRDGNKRIRAAEGEVVKVREENRGKEALLREHDATIRRLRTWCGEGSSIARAQRRELEARMNTLKVQLEVSERRRKAGMVDGVEERWVRDLDNGRDG